MQMEESPQFNEVTGPVSTSGVLASGKAKRGRAKPGHDEVVLVVTRRPVEGLATATRLVYDGETSTVLLPSGDVRVYRGVAPVDAVGYDPDLHDARGWEETAFRCVDPDLVSPDWLLDVIRPCGDALSPRAWGCSGTPLFDVLDEPERPALFDHKVDWWCTDHRISLDGKILCAARLAAGDFAVVSVASISAPHHSWTPVLRYSWIGTEDDAGTNGFYFVRQGLLAYVCDCTDDYLFMMERVPPTGDIVNLLRPRLRLLGGGGVDLVRAHSRQGAKSLHSCGSAYCYQQTSLSDEDFERLTA